MRHFTRTPYYTGPDDPERGQVRGTLELGETVVIGDERSVGTIRTSVSQESSSRGLRWTSRRRVGLVPVGHFRLKVSSLAIGLR